MKKSLLLLIGSIFLFIVACGNTNFESGESTANVETSDQVSEYKEDSNMEKARVEHEKQAEHIQERMIAYEANLSIKVNDLDKVIPLLEEKVDAIGGFLVESSVYTVGEGKKNANFQVRIPKNEFEPFLAFIEANSVEVVNRNVHGEDITEEYVDLESRLKAKRVVEERLLTFMNKAEKTEDLLKISNDLASVQEEIERVEGKLKYLRNRTDYSKVSLHIEDTKVVIPNIKSQEELNTLGNIEKTFIESLQGLAKVGSGLIVFIVGYSPVWLLLGVVGLAAYYLIKRKKGQGHN